MLGLDRRAARFTWTAFVILLVIYVVYLAREAIIVFTLAIFFAYMLSPVVRLVERFQPPRLPKAAPLAIVYIILVAVLILLGSAIGSTVAEQATSLGERLPGLVRSQDPLRSLPIPQFLDPLRGRILEALRNQLSSLDENAIPIIRKAVEAILSRAAGILTFVLIPILAFFFLKDGPKIRESLLALAGDDRSRQVFDGILLDLHNMLGHYIRALVILSAATFVSYTIFLNLIGAQYTVLLAGIAGVLEFIPVVGWITGLIIITLVQGFAGFPHLVWILVFIVVYRMFQDYVLQPYLMGTGVEIPPLMVLFGVLAGEQVAGIPGMFFSVPVLAMLRVIYVRLARARAASRVVT